MFLQCRCFVKREKVGFKFGFQSDLKTADFPQTAKQQHGNCFAEFPSASFSAVLNIHSSSVLWPPSQSSYGIKLSVSSVVAFLLSLLTFSSVLDCIYVLRKAHMHSTPLYPDSRKLPQRCLETVHLIDDGPLAFPLSTPLHV